MSVIITRGAITTKPIDLLSLLILSKTNFAMENILKINFCSLYLLYEQKPHQDY